MWILIGQDIDSRELPYNKFGALYTGVSSPRDIDTLYLRYDVLSDKSWQALTISFAV